MFSAGDIAELEKKYSTYIKKRMIKLLLFFFSFVIILLLLFYFFLYEKTIPKTLKSPKINKTQTMQIPKEPTLVSASTPLASKTVVKPKSSRSLRPTQSNKKQTTHISPQVLNINNNPDANITQTDTVPHLQPQKSRQNTTNTDALVLKLPTIKLEPEKKVAPIVKKEISKVKSTKAKQEIKKPLKDKGSGIKIQMKRIDSISYLKDRFNENHSIIFALMLCKEYYQKKNFANTLKWSIIANDIDNTSEKSWVWFAKSKYKLGKKDDAIKALKAFLKTNDSSKIKSLLHDIINGELYD